MGFQIAITNVAKTNNDDQSINLEVTAFIVESEIPNIHTSTAPVLDGNIVAIREGSQATEQQKRGYHFDTRIFGNPKTVTFFFANLVKDTTYPFRIFCEDLAFNRTSDTLLLSFSTGGTAPPPPAGIHLTLTSDKTQTIDDTDPIVFTVTAKNDAGAPLVSQTIAFKEDGQAIGPIVITDGFGRADKMLTFTAGSHTVQATAPGASSNIITVTRKTTSPPPPPGTTKSSIGTIAVIAGGYLVLTKTDIAKKLFRRLKR